jgi:hypothetical protein
MGHDQLFDFDVVLTWTASVHAAGMSMAEGGSRAITC